MRKIVASTLLTLLLSLSALSQGTISAEGSSTVTSVLWFFPTEITVKSSGDLTLTGEITWNGETIDFSVTGETSGPAISDMKTLATTAWNLVTASGMTEAGVPLSLRGGVTIIGSEIDFATCSLGSGTGFFFFVVEFKDQLVYVRGDAEETSTGTFVPPEKPSTMQLVVTGTFIFQGEVLPEEVASGLSSKEALLRELPWDLSAWPEEFRTQLVELILNPAVQQEP